MPLRITSTGTIGPIRFSHRETLTALSKDLGRGDSRGRWVKMVYLRGMDSA